MDEYGNFQPEPSPDEYERPHEPPARMSGPPRAVTQAPVAKSYPAEPSQVTPKAPFAFKAAGRGGGRGGRGGVPLAQSQAVPTADDFPSLGSVAPAGKKGKRRP